MKSVKQLYGEALAFSQAGYFAEAVTLYQQILEITPTEIQAWWALGKVYCYQADWYQAVTAFNQALTLDSKQGKVYADLGFVWQQLGEIHQAISAYQTAIHLDPDDIQVYHLLGNLYSEYGDFQQAEQYYRQGILIDPYEIDCYLSLGNLLMMQNQVKQAITLYQQALEYHLQHPDLLYQYGLAIATHSTSEEAAFYLASAAYSQQDYQTAIDYYQTLINTDNIPIEIYLNLGDCYQQLDQVSTAIDLYQTALNYYPDSVDVYLALIVALQNSGQTEAAMKIAETALQKLPQNIRLKLANQRILPILYQTQTEIKDYRDRFQQLLTDIIKNYCLETPEDKQLALHAIGENTNFYLQYQGDNDVKLQQQYGEFVSQVMAANYPKNTQNRNSVKKEKVKIGYISAFLQWHTVGIVFLGWTKQHDSKLFEIYCYHLGTESDEITDLFKYNSDCFYHIPNKLEDVIQQININQIDILVFLDIGMSPLTTQLAGLRLAPIQCAAWGHPVTTGLPTIDYFISAELLESHYSKNHYSEQLFCLPNIGIYYQKPHIPICLKKRSDFNLKTDSIIYLSTQSLFKYLPQNDSIFAAIAQQVKKAQFIFFSHWNTEITQQFQQRLSLAFTQFGLSFQDYCLILPRLNKTDYLQLHLLADIALDTFQFTGFLTSLDAIACNLPIVTHVGQLMRSRQTGGILKRIKVTETIAQNPSEYIKIAIRLGIDSEWRRSIVQKIQANQSILYQDNECVESLEQFYLSILK